MPGKAAAQIKTERESIAFQNSETGDTNQLLQGWNKEGDVLMRGQLNLQQSAQQCLTCQLEV